LGQTGKDCFDAIVNTDIRRLGAAMNHCMRCWEAILPHTVQHPLINIDLKGFFPGFNPGTPAPCIPGAAADT
jgi:hypothetical protein